MIKDNSGLRSLCVHIFFILCFVCLYLRVFSIQVIRHEELLGRGLNLHRLNVKIEPRRGTIYDRDGRPLAMSVSVRSAYAVPEVIDRPEDAAEKIAGILHLPREDIFRKLRTKKRFVWLARKIDDGTAEELDALGIEGVGFREEVKRVYPQGSLLGHVLGFVDVDNRGLEGLELQADGYLKGQAGWRASHRDRKGREIVTLRSQDIPAIDGCDLWLTVDMVIQHIAETELEKGCRKYNASAGCLIVMNPRTGAVLALASWPFYDPNTPAAFPAEHRRNRCITDMYEPGSTFKVITVATAIDRGCVEMGDLFFCENGAFHIGRRTLHDVHPYGNLTTTQIIRKSSNIGAVKVAMKLGAEKLHDGIGRFGFGSPTGIGLPGEAGGMLHPLRSWSRISITAIPMGHELAVTPLQMATAVSALANDGLLMRPRIIEAIKGRDGSVIRAYPPEARGRAVSDSAADALVSAMEGVAGPEGTAPRAALDEYTVAGKTGTSQKIEGDGHYSHSRFVGSFVGFAPAQNPAILALVSLDEPRPVYYGGAVAAPVFKEVATRVLKYLRVQPDKEKAVMTVVSLP